MPYNGRKQLWSHGSVRKTDAPGTLGDFRGTVLAAARPPARDGAERSTCLAKGRASGTSGELALLRSNPDWFFGAEPAVLLIRGETPRHTHTVV